MVKPRWLTNNMLCQKRRGLLTSPSMQDRWSREVVLLFRPCLRLNKVDLIMGSGGQSRCSIFRVVGLIRGQAAVGGMGAFVLESNLGKAGHFKGRHA